VSKAIKPAAEMIGVRACPSIKLPLWLRVLLIVAFILVAAADLFGYRYYARIRRR
jgi:hypothetical protein